MKHRVDVVHVLGTGARHARGIALTVMNLADSLDRSRYRLSAIFLQDDGPLGDTLRDKGVAVRAINWQGGRADIGGAMRFARALGQIRPSIVHLHAGGMSPRFISKAAIGARVIVHLHSLEEENKSPRSGRRSALGADLIIANSRATAATVRGATPMIVYPGVNVSDRPQAVDRSGRITIGVAARLSPVKGIAYLIAALGNLREDFPDLSLEIAGDGPEREALEESAKHAGIADRVIFLGWVDDIERIMSKWDILAQPSLAEGLGISALEAMALGIPVIASDVGGLREIIVDEETGFLVPPRDSGALVMKIGELARNASLRSTLGENAREHVAKTFSRERESHAIQSAYERLLA